MVVDQRPLSCSLRTEYALSQKREGCRVPHPHLGRCRSVRRMPERRLVLWGVVDPSFGESDPVLVLLLLALHRPSDCPRSYRAKGYVETRIGPVALSTRRNDRVLWTV